MSAEELVVENANGKQRVVKVIVKEVQKTTVACDACRTQHTKCDGKFPCSYCVAKNRQCEYSEPKKRGPKRRLVAKETGDQYVQKTEQQQQPNSAEENSLISLVAATTEREMLDNIEANKYFDFYLKFMSYLSVEESNELVRPKTTSKKVQAYATLAASSRILGDSVMSQKYISQARMLGGLIYDSPDPDGSAAMLIMHKYFQLVLDLPRATHYATMAAQKQRYFHAFWKRLSNKQALALVQYKAYLEENREKIGNCYSNPEVCKEDKFVEMILLDSVFIMELFLRKANKSEQENDDQMFTTSWVCKITQRDLLLLENQLPMFVLEELHTRVVFLGGGDIIGKNSSPTSTKEKINNRAGFIELAFNYFEDFYPHKSSQKLEMIQNCKSCKHFTDLIRYTYLPRKIQVKGVNPSENFTPCPAEYVPRTATKLNEAGVSFERVQGRSFLDIRFKSTPILSWFLCLGCLRFTRCLKVRLQIPQLKVDQVTECVLRNLIALEQCHYSDQPFVCNYVSLIDSLIHTQEDVELLVDRETIVHELGSHTELATLVNGLCRHMVVTSNYYGKIIRELNEHYNSCWKHYMGMLRSVYFRDPWRLSSTIVGVAVFLFAVVNFLRVIGVLHPNGIFG